jgi:hypothetical protein
LREAPVTLEKVEGFIVIGSIARGPTKLARLVKKGATQGKWRDSPKRLSFSLINLGFSPQI